MHESTSKEKKDFLLEGFTIDPNLRDYSNEPYFNKKDEEAKKFLETPGVLEKLEKILNKK